MLSRTADNLFWLARYMERADNIARLLQVAERMSNIGPGGSGAHLPDGVAGSEWRSAIIAAGCEDAYFEKYDEATAEQVADYLVRDRDNPSSILSCMETARHNARSVRTALTADMWEAVNSTWLQLRELPMDARSPEQLARLIDWTRERTELFHGAYANTMLRTEAFQFTRLGHFLERADNTARILDVKYHVLLPTTDSVGGVLDYYQWTALLRVVSALRAYHVVYPGRIVPWNVAELMILRKELPRSLLFCYEQMESALNLIALEYGEATDEVHRQAGALHAELRYARMADIFQTGLHEFLTEVIERTAKLGAEIARKYLA
jgi:uncharacterized alpha-E superfamily protein